MDKEVGGLAGQQRDLGHRQVNVPDIASVGQLEGIRDIAIVGH